MSLLPFLHHVSSGHPLSAAQAHQAMSVILQGAAPDAVIAGFLVALKMRGETAEEIAGFARAMREQCVPVDVGPELRDQIVDIVGTGGDGAGTFNISTVAAIVLAGAGVKVAKHGNRAISGKVGSADVLEALGVRISMTADEAVRAVREIGLGFMFAPNLHPAMKYAQPVRRELKMRTVFNLLGPLANPAGTQRQVVGAPSSEIARTMAEALQNLGTGHSFVVHGQDGTDEVSATSTTDVYEITGIRLEKHVWAPEDFGIKRVSLGELSGGDAAHNAKIALAILHGAPGAPRTAVVLNAAAGLLAAEKAENPRDAVAKASQAIDSGMALAVLEELRKYFPAT